MVYVDDAAIPYGRMKMHHMVADAEEELRAMAETIGVPLHWHQYPGTAKSHFDICQSKRNLALGAGAIAIQARQCAAMVSCRKLGGELGDPSTAIERREALLIIQRDKLRAASHG